TSAGHYPFPYTTLFRSNGATIKAGTEVKLLTERPEFSLTLSEMELGSWIIFELPGMTKAEAKEAASLDALRKAGETSYFKDKDRSEEHTSELQSRENLV